MRTKRSDEGCILIDHRNSPGITAEFLAANKIDAPAVGAGQTFESAMKICHGCGRDIIQNPNRSRPQEWCMQHDAYLCDGCGLTRKLTGSCVPLRERVYRIYKKLSASA